MDGEGFPEGATGHHDWMMMMAWCVRCESTRELSEMRCPGLDHLSVCSIDSGTGAIRKRARQGRANGVWILGS